VNRYYLGWLAWLLVGAAYELWAIRWRTAPGDTLSEFTGKVFAAGTMWGWWALMLLMGALAAWYPQHVRRLSQRKSDADRPR